MRPPPTAFPRPRGFPAPVLAGLLLLLVASAPAAAEGPENEWGYDLADEIMSPFCPGRALSECPSPQAGDLRDWILDQERAGVTREEVEAELFRAWGDQLLQAPRAQGVGWVAYLVPAGLFLLGGVLVGIFLRRQGGRPARAVGAAESREGPRAPPGTETQPEGEGHEDEELLRQVDEELDRAPSEGW